LDENGNLLSFYNRSLSCVACLRSFQKSFPRFTTRIRVGLIFPYSSSRLFSSDKISMPLSRIVSELSSTSAPNAEETDDFATNFRPSADSDSEQFHFPGAEPLPNPLETVTDHEATRDLVNDTESEEFHFPGADPLPPIVAARNQLETAHDSSVPAIATLAHVPVSSYVSSSPTLVTSLAPPSPVTLLASTSSRTQKCKPSPAQLEALHAAASSGDLERLQNVFRHAARNEDVEEFALANDASTRTGLTALHAAASRGHLSVVTWRMLELLYFVNFFETYFLFAVIEECGAMPDMEDKEGEVNTLYSCAFCLTALIRFYRLLYTSLHSMVTCLLFHTFYLTERTYTARTPMDGPHYTMLVPRY
jgi:hypothetical protein